METVKRVSYSGIQNRISLKNKFRLIMAGLVITVGTLCYSCDPNDDDDDDTSTTDGTSGATSMNTQTPQILQINTLQSFKNKNLFLS